MLSERHDFVANPCIALLNRSQNAGYIAHSNYFYWKIDDFSSICK